MFEEIPDSVRRLAVALAIGLLIGLERGWHSRDLGEGQRIAGIRTFGLIGLLGGLSATLAEDFGHLIISAGLLATAIAFGIAQWRDPRQESDVSITTNIAALVAYGLGALAGMGAMLTAAAASVVTALLLSVKTELHSVVERIERAELLATIRLLLISVVVLPVLPDRGFGPWNALNPYQLWWMVVLVAGISYVGYFTNRIIGEQRGILITGVLGGLVSSTATIISLSRHARHRAADTDLAIAGMLAATATMFPRTIIVASVFEPRLMAILAPPLLSASVIAAGAAALFARRTGPVDNGPQTAASPENPLDLKTALQITLILAPVMLLTRALKEWSGDVGLYGVAALSGMIDIDAITLSLSTMAAEASTPVQVAATSIVLACIVNTIVKPAIAVALGGWRVGIRLSLPALLAICAISAIWFVA